MWQCRQISLLFQLNSLLLSLLMCHCSHLTDTITILIIIACPTFCRSSATLLLEPTTCHKSAWIATDWLIALICPFIVQHIWSKENEWFLFLKWKVLVLAFYRSICAFSYMSFAHVYCCWFRCSMYLCTH